MVSATTDGTVVIADQAGPPVPKADLVVGADGVGSAVRASGSFGASARGTGRWYVRGVLPVGADVDGAELTGEHWTRLGVFGGAPVGGGLFYFYCSADAPRISQALKTGDRGAFARSWAAALPATAGVLDVLGSLDTLLVHQAHRVVCDRWVDDRLVLLGDAAHAMEPTLGQGANSALLDAAVLCSEVSGEVDLGAAVRRYERRRRHRVTAVQRSSDRLARLAGLRGGVSRTARDAVLRALSRRALMAHQAHAAQQEPPAAVLHELSKGLGDSGGLAAQADALPESLRETLGMDQLTTAAGYIQSTIFGMNALVLLLIFAIGFGTRALAGEEEAGTLDLLLAHPVSRRQLVLERVAALAVSAIALSAAIGVSVWAFSSSLGLDVPASGIAAASLGLALLATACGTLAVAVGAAVGRRATVLAATAGTVFLAYLLRAVAPQVAALDGLERMSPFDWYLGADPVATGADLVGLTLLAALTVASAAAAAVLVERRDIRT